MSRSSKPIVMVAFAVAALLFSVACVLQVAQARQHTGILNPTTDTAKAAEKALQEADAATSGTSTTSSSSCDGNPTAADDDNWNCVEAGFAADGYSDDIGAGKRAPIPDPKETVDVQRGELREEYKSTTLEKIAELGDDTVPATFVEEQEKEHAIVTRRRQLARTGRNYVHIDDLVEQDRLEDSFVQVRSASTRRVLRSTLRGQSSARASMYARKPKIVPLGLENNNGIDAGGGVPVCYEASKLKKILDKVHKKRGDPDIWGSHSPAIYAKWYYDSNGKKQPLKHHFVAHTKPGMARNNEAVVETCAFPLEVEHGGASPTDASHRQYADAFAEGCSLYSNVYRPIRMATKQTIAHLVAKKHAKMTDWPLLLSMEMQFFKRLAFEAAKKKKAGFVAAHAAAPAKLGGKATWGLREKIAYMLFEAIPSDKANVAMDAKEELWVAAFEHNDVHDDYVQAVKFFFTDALHKALQCWPATLQSAGMLTNGIDNHDEGWYDEEVIALANVPAVCGRLATQMIMHFNVVQYSHGIGQVASLYRAKKANWNSVCQTTAHKANCRVFTKCWQAALARVCGADKRCCPSDEVHTACHKQYKGGDCRSGLFQKPGNEGKSPYS
jgi:hypothetical protein